ncbi:MULTISPECIES: hypothetical protein [unclassified Variovorax]|nr:MULTISPECIES: hypothetical protein [unclassified Variovorax]VTU42932.1 hypothetical protein H6P1_00315 [Variovorax sp. PBL-H6]VTU43576.1 hypothetical protein SRS16P1_00590 [Variovorax sp. SRS16]VTU43639.1 hypothetical protein E5P1_00584 [Variovorax sp. PBL-E5]
MLASIAVAIFIFAASPNPFAVDAVGNPFSSWSGDVVSAPAASTTTN